MPPPKQNPTTPELSPVAPALSSVERAPHVRDQVGVLIAPRAAVASGTPPVPPARESRSGASAL